MCQSPSIILPCSQQIACAHRGQHPFASQHLGCDPALFLKKNKQWKTPASTTFKPSPVPKGSDTGFQQSFKPKFNRRHIRGLEQNAGQPAGFQTMKTQADNWAHSTCWQASIKLHCRTTQVSTTPGHPRTSVIILYVSNCENFSGNVPQQLLI